MKRINWIHSIIIPAATALMVATWVAPALRWLIRSTGADAAAPVPATLFIALLIFAGVGAARFALNPDRTRQQRNVSVIGGGLIAIVVTIALTYRDQFPSSFLRGLIDWRDSVSPEVIVLIGLGLVWWRGIAAGRDDALNDESFEGTFYRGVAALAGLLVVNTATRFVSQDDILLSVLTFFTIAVAGLALINIERARVRQNSFGMTWRKIYRQWSATILSVVAIILLLGLGITNLAAPGTVGRWWASLQPLFEALGSFIATLLTLLYTIAAFLATPLIPILQWLAQLLLNVIMAGLTILHNLGAAFNQARVQQDFDNFLNSQTFIVVSRSVALFMVLAAIAIAAIWWLRRSRRLAAKPTDEIRDSIASRELLWAQLKNLVARWRSGSRLTVPPLYLPLATANDDPRAIIRRAYRAMLEWARLLGRSRFPYQTPLMYADMLAADMPQIRSAIADLTQAYLLARYSIDPLPPDEARRAQAALDQVLASYSAPTTALSNSFNR